MSAAFVAALGGFFTVAAVVVAHLLSRRDNKSIAGTVQTIEVNTNQRLSDALNEIRELKVDLLQSIDRGKQLEATIVTSDKDIPPTTRETGS